MQPWLRGFGAVIGAMATLGTLYWMLIIWRELPRGIPAHLYVTTVAPVVTSWVGAMVISIVLVAIAQALDLLTEIAKAHRPNGAPPATIRGRSPLSKE